MATHLSRKPSWTDRHAKDSTLIPAKFDFLRYINDPHAVSGELVSGLVNKYTIRTSSLSVVEILVARGNLSGHDAITTRAKRSISAWAKFSFDRGAESVF